MKKALRLALTVGTVLALAGCTGGDTEPATNVTATSATLNAKGSCEAGDAGRWWFEYRPGTSGAWKPTQGGTYGGPTDCDGQVKRISEPVSNLDGRTQYQFRVCATDPTVWQGPSCADKGGVSNTPDWETFTTKKLGGFHENWFGGGTTELLRAAKNSGAGVARFNVLWCRLEPDQHNVFSEPAKNAWRGVINQMRLIMDEPVPDDAPNVVNGMRPLPILINAPVWARAPGDQPAGGTGCAKKKVLENGAYRDAKDAAYPPDDDHVPHWNHFVGRFIRCMRGIGDGGGGCPPDVIPPANLEMSTPRIQGYEIWNEPNLAKYWGKAEEGFVWKSDADRFTRMLRGAFAVPHARPIVLGGLSFSFPNNNGQFGDADEDGDPDVGATKYLERVYNLLEFSGDPPQFDAIAVHPYGAGLHTNAKIAHDQVIDTIQKRNEHNDDTRVWVTEVGDDGCPENTWLKPNGNPYIDCSPLEPPNEQAIQAGRLLNMWRGGGVENPEIPAPVVIYYRLMDDPYDSGRNMGVLPDGQFSNPKTAYCQLAAQWGSSPC